MAVLAPAPQRSAVGAPGQPGDADAIRHLADRYVSVYGQFLSWNERLRGYASSSESAHELFSALAGWADQPIERMRDGVYRFRDEIDTVHRRTLAGESGIVELSIDLELSPDRRRAFEAALAKFEMERE